MLPLETDTLLDNCSISNMIDQLIDNKCFCTNINPNSQPMTSNEFANKTISGFESSNTVNKSYELNENIIQESYFDTNGMDDVNEFIRDYASGYPNGIILVLNEMELNLETELLTVQLDSQLKHIVVCNSNLELEECNDKQTHAQNLESAANAAYKMATSGQAILFQGVSKNFDLISHIH